MEIPSNPSNANDDSNSSSQTECNPAIMKPETHVLLVDHNAQSLNSTAKMLEQCSYQVTKVKLATSAVKIILSGKKHFDVVMADLHTPDIIVIQRLLEEAIQRDILVIITAEKDDPCMAYNALENGAFLFIQKPPNEELMRYLWQFVTREKLQKNCGEILAKINMAGENKRISITKGKGKDSATNGGGGGEENTGVGSENAEVSSQKTTRKRKDTNGDELNRSAPEPNPSDNCNKKKVCTEWTKELHGKFMDAIHQLGEGKCYPKEILEIMQVPDLTRMQVASHLQKCRLDNWRAPEQRKHRPRNRAPSSSKKQKAKGKAKLRRFGTMPSVEGKSKGRGQQNSEVPIINSVPSDHSKGRGQQNSEVPIINSVPSDHTNTDFVDPENGETSVFPTNNNEQFDIMEFLNRDTTKFPIWQSETSPGVWNNETSIPSPSAATATTFGMDSDYYYRPDMSAFDSATAAAMGSNVCHQQTTDDLSFEFDDDIDINSLMPEFLDLVKESELKNHSQAQSNAVSVPSDECFPQQADCVQGDFADASRFQP